jgi:hypothetical protein
MDKPSASPRIAKRFNYKIREFGISNSIFEKEMLCSFFFGSMRQKK